MMRRNNIQELCSSGQRHLLLAVVVFVWLRIPSAVAVGNAPQDVNFAGFYTALEKTDDTAAITAGDPIFGRIEQKYRTDAGFAAFKSKLMAAEFLASQMESQLRKATGRQMYSVAGDLFESKKKTKKDNSLAVAPAKSFYETSVDIFSKPVRIEKLDAEEKKFLITYYDLKLRLLTSSIAKAGQALSIAEPDFKGTHDYVLVLPLLHASEERPVNIAIIPTWMRQAEQLEVFADSCLLHYGLGFHAMTLAKKAVQIKNGSFSEEQYYTGASKKCGKAMPNVAVDCLQRAIRYIKPQDVNSVVNLQFDIAQLWLDSDNYNLAAGQAKKISDTFATHQEAGKAIWLYYYALSRANNADAILNDVDTSLTDARCEAYKGRLMYLKWWALRRKRDDGARIAALEHELLKQYGKDPMVAPILLSRATDLLAGQDYNGAYSVLTDLQDKFASTQAAAQAKRIMEKLKAVKNPK
jgi:hypothetical protein